MRYFGKNKILTPSPFNLTKFRIKILEQCDEFVQSEGITMN